MSFINRSIAFLAFLAVTVVVARTSFAQSYYNAPNDTIIGTAPFNDVSVFNITQVHPTTDTVHFVWHKQMVTMPLTWEASICDAGDCYTTLKDSGTMAPIVPGDNGLMSLHINPFSEAGTGIIRFSIFAKNTPTQVDTLTWIISAYATSVAQLPQNEKPIVFSNNHRLICKNINADYKSVLIYSIDGRVLHKEEIHNPEISISLSDMVSQLLIIQLIGKEMLVTRIINN